MFKPPTQPAFTWLWLALADFGWLWLALAVFTPHICTYLRVYPCVHVASCVAALGSRALTSLPCVRRCSHMCPTYDITCFTCLHVFSRVATYPHAHVVCNPTRLRVFARLCRCVHVIPRIVTYCMYSHVATHIPRISLVHLCIVHICLCIFEYSMYPSFPLYLHILSRLSYQ